MGRVWPRQGHHGRPLNSVVSRHMEAWRPASASEIKELLSRQLKDCTSDELAAFEAYRVEPFQVPISRSGNTEAVFVVAQKGAEVMYYEDVEEGFNISRLTAEGVIAEPGYEQDELKWAIRKWQ